MTNVVAEITMSLDGFVTGPDPGPDNGLGTGGEPLHAWVFSDDPVDAAVLRESIEGTGAVVMGRGLFDVIDGPNGWNDATGYGGGIASDPSFFVVTHAPPSSVRLDLPITFVTDGLRATVEQARAAAAGKDVVVMGGGDVVRQCVEDGIADLLRIHLSPMVLGAGTPLFAGGPRRELTQLSSRASSSATHLTYAVTR